MLEININSNITAYDIATAVASVNVNKCFLNRNISVQVYKKVTQICAIIVYKYKPIF